MHRVTRARATESAVQGLTTQLFQERWIDAQSEWVEQHLRLLCDLRRLLGNDLDKAIILAVIGQRMMRDAVDGTGNDGAYNPEKFTNTESIALSTGIPRESVRRKIVELGVAGWVARDSRGRLQVLPKARDELASSSMIVVELLDRIFAKFAGMMAAEDWVEIRAPIAGQQQEAAVPGLRALHEAQ